MTTEHGALLSHFTAVSRDDCGSLGLWFRDFFGRQGVDKLQEGI